MAKDTKKTKLPSFTTQEVTFVYPKLTEPDYGSKDYPNPDGAYSVKGRTSKDTFDAFADTKVVKKPDGTRVSLNDLYEDARKEAVRKFAELPIKTRKEFEKKGITGPVMNSMVETDYDKETEEETGEVMIKASRKASGVFKKGPKEGQKWEAKVVLFDAKGRQMKGKLPNIWGGTTGKLSISVSPYFIEGTAAAGLKFFLDAAQILDLVSEGSRSADSYGFGEEEGYGFDPDQFADEDKTSDDSDTSGGSSAGEDDF